jgi:hypothetical protein
MNSPTVGFIIRIGRITTSKNIITIIMMLMSPRGGGEFLKLRILSLLPFAS